MRSRAGWAVAIALGMFAAVALHACSERRPDAETTATTTQAMVTDADAGILTNRGDIHRSGVFVNPTLGSPTALGQIDGGVNFHSASQPYTVDGPIYAEPLVVSSVPTTTCGNKTVANLLIVATTTDGLFAFDADAPGSPPCWSNSFGLAPTALNCQPGFGQMNTGLECDKSNPNPPPCCDAGATCCEIGSTELINGGNNCGNISHFGILSTPVVSGTTLFLLSASVPTEDAQGRATSLAFTLWSVDLTNGFKIGQSQALATPTNFGGVPFDPTHQIQRPGLLLANNVVYAGFSSSCDAPIYEGWVLAFDVSVPTAPTLLAGLSDTAYKGQGGIWQSGSGLTGDDNGHVYFSSGNGNAGSGQYGDSVVKLDTSKVDAGILTVADYFTPYDQQPLNGTDLDLGVSGPTYVPAGGAGGDWIIAGSKFGKVYVLNAGNVDGGMGETGTADANDLKAEFPGPCSTATPPPNSNKYFYAFTPPGGFALGGDSNRALDVIQATCNLGSAIDAGGSPDCVHDLELPCGLPGGGLSDRNGFWPHMHGTPVYWPGDVNNPASGGFLFVWGQYDWMRRYQIQTGGTFARDSSGVPVHKVETEYASGRLAPDQGSTLASPLGFGAQMVITTDNAGSAVVWGSTLSSPYPKADNPCQCNPSALPTCPPNTGVLRQPLTPCVSLDGLLQEPHLASQLNSSLQAEARPGRLTAFDATTMKLLFQDGEPPYVGAKFTPVTPYRDRVFQPTLSDGVTQNAQIRVYGIDTDGDGWIDIEDNCPTVANHDQKNTNADAERALSLKPVGDACDPLASTAGGIGLDPLLGANALRFDSFIGNAAGNALPNDAGMPQPTSGTSVPVGCYCPVESITDCANVYGCSIARDADLPPPYGTGSNPNWHALTDQATGQPFQPITTTFAERSDSTIVGQTYTPMPQFRGWDVRADAPALCPTCTQTLPIVLWTHVTSMAASAPAGTLAPNINDGYARINVTVSLVLHPPIPPSRTPWMPGPVLDPDAWLPPNSLPFFVFGTTSQGTTQIIEQNGSIINDATATWSSDALALAGGVVAGTYDAITGDDVVLGVAPGSDVPSTIIVTAGTTHVVGGLRVTPGGVVSVHPVTAPDPPNGPVKRAYSAHKGWLFGLSSATGQPALTVVDVTGALRGSPHSISRPVNGAVPANPLAMAWDAGRRRLLVLDDLPQGGKHVLRLLSVAPSSASVEIWHLRPVEKLPDNLSLSLSAAGEILVSLVGVPGTARSELLVTTADGVPEWSADFNDSLLLPAFGSGLGIVLPFQQAAKNGGSDLRVDFEPRTSLVPGICGANWLRARVDVSPPGPLGDPRTACGQ